MTDPWLYVELGGSSAQTAQRDASGRFWFTPGVVREPGRPVALACPGIIRNGRVLYATNLGWPDVADPAHALGLDQLRVVVNDAEAAALGESILRSNNTPELDLIYITLGTGLGIACVEDGQAIDPNLAHLRVGGGKYCSGCRNTDCLNSLVCSQNLPDSLSEADQACVAQALASGLQQAGVPGEKLLVVGGGLARRYPAIVSILNSLVLNPTEPTAAPPEAKSAAFAGLAYLAG